MTESELLHTESDKRPAGSSMPRERLQRASGKPPGRAVLWNATPGVGFDPAPVWGAFPQRFVGWAIKRLGAPAAKVLHVCSGMLDADVGGVRVDLRAAARPDVRADGTCLPFADNTFRAVLLDPPYSIEYARDLYGVDYDKHCRPSQLLAEAARVVKPGGLIGFLHFLVPMPPPATRFVEVHGVTQGCGYRIRAFTVFEKEAARDLFATSGDSAR